jgi:phosphotransferase family enzyme
VPAGVQTVASGWDTEFDALRPFAKPPDWLAATADPVRVAEVVQRSIPEIASGRVRLDMFEIRRVRIRQGSNRALYRVSLTDGRGERKEVQLRGELLPPGAAEPEPAQNGARFPSPDWRGYLPELRVDLTLEPPDSALPGLATLVDAERARAWLERTIRASSGHAELRIRACSPQVMRYNPGSRCTVLYELEYASDRGGRGWPETVVAKAWHGSKGPNAWQSMRALWSSSLRTSDVVSVAEPLGFDPQLNVLVQTGLPEEMTLKELVELSLASGTPQAIRRLASFVGKAALALAELHACGAEALEVVTFDDELEELRGQIARLAELVPPLGDAARPLLARLEVIASDSPAGALVPTHRSFRPAQLLLNGENLSLIDFDGLCRAEPALDVGLFRASVRSAGLKVLVEAGAREQTVTEHVAQMDELCEAFLAQYEARMPVSRLRVALWEAVDLMTLVVHSWTKVKFDRLDYSLQLLEHHLRVGELARW